MAKKPAPKPRGRAGAKAAKPPRRRKAKPGTHADMPEHLRPSHWFKPGQSGNPQGGKLHDPEIKKLKNLTKSELTEIGNIIVQGNMAQLMRVAIDGEQPAIRAMIASVALRIINKGDMAALDVLLNRLVGKVKDEVVHSGTPPQIIVTLPSNGREAKI